LGQSPTATRCAAIIWDFDGTLVDSPVAVAAATNAALAAAGFPAADLAAVKAGMVLPTIPRMAHHAGLAADDPRAAELADAFYRHAARAFPGVAKPFPGVAEALRELHRRGVPQAVVTNNLGPMVRETLAANGLLACFASVLGDGDLPRLKPDPIGPRMAAAACGVDPAACAYVGDSAVDAATATGAGMLAVAVPWGTTPRAALTGFALVLDRPADILRLIP
jgi:phosphoglycolate phosphatase